MGGETIAQKLDMSLDELTGSKGGKEATKGGGRGGDSNCRVFVGNLPFSTSWQDLKDHMRSVGEVVHCDILAAPGTALGSKGCGLVEYSTPAAAERAIAELTETEMKGRPIFVREDRENDASSREGAHRSGGGSKGCGSKGGGAGAGGCRVFVGNLAFKTSWQDLKDHMRSVGDVLHCDILGEPGTALGSKGCGLVEFASAAAARRAIRELTDTDLNGRQIFVREDRERGGGKDKGGKGKGRERSSDAYYERRGSGHDRSRSRGRGNAKGCRVFVGNLAFSVTWQELKDHMRQAGDVTRCDIIAEPGTTLGSKGCAIVEYNTPAQARQAIRKMSDTEIKGRQIFVREDREED